MVSIEVDTSRRALAHFACAIVTHAAVCRVQHGRDRSGKQISSSIPHVVAKHSPGYLRAPCDFDHPGLVEVKRLAHQLRQELHRHRTVPQHGFMKAAQLKRIALFALDLLP